MPELIGGSPSSGSSLLANILNRHSKIYCGQETHLFTKAKLYTDWNGNKRRLLSKSWMGLRSPGIHRFNGVQLEHFKNTEELVSKSNSLIEFANSYFSQFGKSTWIEKTPANAYSFDLFSKVDTQAKIIRIVRNPYDSIASLRSRGIPLVKAAALYLCNNLVNLNNASTDNYFYIRYEDLVSKPNDTVERLMQHLGLDFEEQMLEGESEKIQMKGWLQNEKGEIASNSVGRFQELKEEDQILIRFVLSKIRLKAKMLKSYNTSLRSIEELCELYDYEYIQVTGKINISTLDNWMDKFVNTIKLYPTNLFNYPVTLN